MAGFLCYDETMQRLRKPNAEQFIGVANNKFNFKELEVILLHATKNYATINIVWFRRRRRAP